MGSKMGEVGSLMAKAGKPASGQKARESAGSSLGSLVKMTFRLLLKWLT
jgi:hypothetical protein